jgi:alpha-glucoside transport system permease protein
MTAVDQSRISTNFHEPVGTPLLSRIWVRATLTLIAVIWTFPTLGVLISSFRPKDDVATSGWWTVLTHPFEATWTLSNYSEVLSTGGMTSAFINSLLVSIPSTILPIAMAAIAAYALAHIRFRGSRLVLAIVVGLLVVPAQLALVPLLSAYNATGLTGTYLGIWLAHTGFGLPLAIYLLYTFMSDLPHDIFESARVDGASHVDVFFRIVLPLSMPAIAAIAIFQFVWTWNDLLLALIFLGTGSDVAVLTARLNDLVGTRGQDWHLLTAGAFVTMALPLAIFLIFQRHFVRGLLTGSVKG